MKIGNYEIIKIETYKETPDFKTGVLLGKHPSPKCPQRYATWEYVEEKGKSINAFWGHYYENENDAKKDYYERLAEHYNKPWQN